MNLKDATFQEILSNLDINERYETSDMDKFKSEIDKFHYDYMIGASKEARILIDKKEKINNIYDFMESLYFKRLKIHVSLVTWIELFEITLKARVAQIMSRKFSSSKDEDDWYRRKLGIEDLDNTIELIKKRPEYKNKSPKNSFEFLNVCHFSDIISLITSGWSAFNNILVRPMVMSNDKFVPWYGSQEYISKILNNIRDARNQLFHGNPQDIRFHEIISNTYYLMLRFDVDLKELYKRISSLDDTLLQKYCQ